MHNPRYDDIKASVQKLKDSGGKMKTFRFKAETLTALDSIMELIGNSFTQTEVIERLIKKEAERLAKKAQID